MILWNSHVKRLVRPVPRTAQVSLPQSGEAVGKWMLMHLMAAVVASWAQRITSRFTSRPRTNPVSHA